MSAFMAIYEKQVNVQCGIGSISMLISISTAGIATSKNLKFSFLENNRVHNRVQ